MHAFTLARAIARNYVDKFFPTTFSFFNKKRKTRRKRKKRGLLTQSTLSIDCHNMICKKFHTFAHHCDMVCSGARIGNHREVVEGNHVKCITIKTRVSSRAIFVDNMVIARRAMPLGIPRVFLPTFF
jgi:hypothetical protein